jgi:glyoxylase-like metal-dependent hydrolase (beta-lactamase superfamily II)
MNTASLHHEAEATVGLYFRQWLAGRDFATTDDVAAQMRNFVYAIGDTETRDCVLVDPAWDIAGLLRRLDADGMRLTGALATHYHPDHIGGSMFGFSVEGLPTLIATRPVPIHVHADEGPGVCAVTGLSENDLVRHRGGDEVKVGDVRVQLLHTPGHTPGSQCFLVDGKLVAGDTLFVQGCGRVDLPGGDPQEMYRTLTQRLATLPDGTMLYPGHDYADRPSSTLAEERRTNSALQAVNLDAWLRRMGAF